MRSKGPFKLDNPWVWIGWSSAVGLVTVGVVLGFGVLGREQQNGRPLGLWAGICRGLGITSDTGPAGEPQPPLRTPTRIAWTRATLAQVAGGNVERGEFVAMNCTACHGEQGVSSSGLYPALAGMDAAVIYKQLDDFRAGKRSWGAMNGIVQALSAKRRLTWRRIWRAAPRGWRLSSASDSRPGAPFGNRILPSGWFLPEIPRAAFRLAPLVTVPAAASLARRLCRGSSLPISNASSRRSPKACARMTSTGKCAPLRRN